MVNAQYFIIFKLAAKYEDIRGYYKILNMTVDAVILN